MGLLDFAHQDYTPSWYADSAPRLAPQPALRGEVSAEVCVIGGGYTGLSTALELAERGVSVVLLEGARLGWAASGRNGGQVLSDLACGMDAVRAELGAEAARAIWAMTQEAARMVGERLAGFGRTDAPPAALEQQDFACGLHVSQTLAGSRQRHPCIGRAMGDAPGIDDGQEKAQINQVETHADRIVAFLPSA